jgi:nucleoid-associated protein YgaU
MECYIEAYNDLKNGAELQAGQTLKIPKLELKKRKKKINK